MTQRPGVVVDPWEALVVAQDDPAWSAVAPAPQRGRVTVVLGAGGGAGASTVASGIALACAADGRGVSLVELDLARGDLAGRWGTPAERTLNDLTAVIGELASDHVQLVAMPHPSGVQLLLAPEDHRAARAWEPAAVGMLLRCAAHVGEVVVDVPPGEVGDAACVAADRVVVVGVPNLGGLRRVRRLLDALGHAGAAVRPVVVLNRGVGRDHLGSRGATAAMGRDADLELCRADREADDIGAGAWPAGRRGRLASAFAVLAGAGAA